ncbi:MAG: hypothetical protein L6V89_05585 [Oscillospiraceae bacterium]|nr:MAG: hypothetical protein L6V89_05585 [Oscillospiraceae bacterium]
MSETKTAKRLTGGIIAIIILAVCLCITTFALVYASVSVENNRFHTGEVKINLNDGKPVIQEHEFIFEPGMTVVKDFFVENDSTWDVYYRLYLDNVSGGLADVLTVTIKDGDKVLYSGTANKLTKQNVAAADDTLKIGQRRNLTAVFHYPETAATKRRTSTSPLRCAPKQRKRKTTPISCSGKKERTKQYKHPTQEPTNALVADAIPASRRIRRFPTANIYPRQRAALQQMPCGNYIPINPRMKPSFPR